MLQLLLIVPLLGALYLIDVYIQPIGLVIGFCSELSNISSLEIITSQLLVSSLLPIAASGRIKPKRLTNLERSQFTLSEELKGILVGLILGDLFIQCRGESGNARLCFEQGMVHEDYLLHLYERFKEFCSASPKIIIHPPDKITGKEYSSIRFNTYSLPCFNELYELFYPEGTKIVPLNIGELLTPLVLAFWVFDDGSWDK